MKTFDETKALKLYHQGLSDIKIGRELNIHYKTIARWRKQNNLPSKFHEHKIQDEDLYRLYMMGFTDVQIGKELGCSAAYVNNWREVNILPTNAKIFDWQKFMEPSERERIPEKYRRVAV